MMRNSKIFNKPSTARKKLLPTKVLLQAGHDVVIFGCSSLSASVWGRTSIAELLFITFYFYIFIHQRLGSDTAMNSLPAAIPDRYRKLHEHPTDYQHSFIDTPKDGQYLVFLSNEFRQKRFTAFR